MLLNILMFFLIVNNFSVFGDYGDMIFNYNNTYKYDVPYKIYVNKRIEYIMEFSDELDTLDAPARVTVASEFANKTYPLFITAQQQKGVSSWQLPMLVQTSDVLEKFTNISRTLCPHNNLFDVSEESCDIHTENKPILHLTSSSPEDVEVTINVEKVTDFYIKLNATTNVTVTPSQPKYYFYPFKQNRTDIQTRKLLCDSKLRVDKPKSKSVILMIDSDDDICALVSIQNYSCPVFDNERDILYDGFYLTMTRRGGITLTQESFPYGFYIVFIVKSSDDDCVEQTVTNNITLPFSQLFSWVDDSINVSNEDSRVKSFSFKLVETISHEEYVTAISVVLGVFLAFYLAFLMAVIFYKPDQVSSRSTDSTESEVAVVPGVHENAEVSIEGTSGGINSAVTSPTMLDSSSDSESEPGDSNLLPHSLCVANLATKRPRVLSARSKLYLWNVLTVGVFYTLPVIQLVVTYQRMLNQSGNQDLCYFNFFCAHPFMALTDFNHVYSNIGYVMLGVLFLVQVWRRHRKHSMKTLEQKELGIPQHFGLLYAMGVALVSEGILSAAYHVCPNSMNFQFDTSFMYVTSVLCMVKIYQSRHPDINARAHATFGVLALIIFIGLVGILNANFYFWVSFTILHIVTCFIMTFQIYYMGRFKLESDIICRVSRELVSRPIAAITPTYVGRMVLLFIANVTNWALAAYGVVQHNRDFASHLLLIMMSNLFLYTLFYIVMKLLHRESIRWYSWIFIFFTYFCWFGSSYFYLDQSTDWALTPAQSRIRNRECSFLQLYDFHDIWHFASAIAMFFSFNMYLTIDDNLSKETRSKIKVF